MMDELLIISREGMRIKLSSSSTVDPKPMMDDQSRAAPDN